MSHRYLYLIVFLLSSSISFAEDRPKWRASNIQFLYGNQYELGPSSRESITIEHASSWQFGESYFFTNVFNRSDTSTEFYAEFYPRLTWKALTARPLPLTLFDDISIVAGINAGNLPKSDPFKAYLLGAGVKFKTSVFDYLKLDVMAFKADHLETTGIQVSPIWGMTFDIAQHRFLFKGFIDWQSAEATGGHASLLAQPQLLIDVGHYWQHDNQFYAGIEYSYWYNKFGLDGVIESVPQVMFLLPF